MFVDFDREEMCLLQRLVDARRLELQLELRRVRAPQLRKELEAEHELLDRVLHQLHECECDVTA